MIHSSEKKSKFNISLWLWVESARQKKYFYHYNMAQNQNKILNTIVNTKFYWIGIDHRAKHILNIRTNVTMYAQSLRKYEGATYFSETTSKSNWIDFLHISISRLDIELNMGSERKAPIWSG